ncbi:MAG: glutathione peroxidase [Glaciecola sp.]|jgi:glutathione peroxidase
MSFKQILQTIHTRASVSSMLLSSLALSALFSGNVTASNTEVAVASNLTATTSACPSWLNESFRRLHSTEDVNVCKAFAGKPLLIVNTASHCGFTYQFSGLEALHQRYKAKGLTVIGFASNDFRQEAKSEAKAATICYENYGVTFTMVSPISVSGDNAHPVFKKLAAQTQAPSWNFTKFLVSSDGTKITRFDSSTAPDSPQMISAIEALL